LTVIDPCNASAQLVATHLFTLLYKQSGLFVFYTDFADKSKNILTLKKKLKPCTSISVCFSEAISTSTGAWNNEQQKF